MDVESKQPGELKVAIVHYWLVNMRGGEKVVEALCEMYPQADIYTHVVDESAISETLKKHNIKTSFISRLPRAIRWYQKYLPLMPMALEQLDLKKYDLVFSSESGPAKGFLVNPGTLHICYCHTPMRYLWDMYHDYLKEAGRLTRFLFRFISHYMRMWDYSSSRRVDHFIANSENVARRIRKHYGREADVVFPPVAVEDFYTSDEDGEFYLMIGQLVGYKRADLAVEAFNKMGKRLVIIGEGEQLESLKKVANSNITLLGRQPFKVIQDHYARCKALIFPGEEDFGIVPVEAMAAGRPVIAYAEGGALETVKDGETGIYFNEQSTESLIAAVERLESEPELLKRDVIVNHASSFKKERFKSEMQSIIERLLKEADF